MGCDVKLRRAFLVSEIEAARFPAVVDCHGPDVLYVVATNINGSSATIVARLSWQESQA